MVADNPNLPPPNRGGDGSIRRAKRDELAARAMESIIGNLDGLDQLTAENQQAAATGISRFAYLIANAMLAEGGRNR